MRNSTWVCFGCKRAVRRPREYALRVPCASCAENMVCIGYKIPVPPKRATRAWARLRDQFADAAPLAGRVPELEYQGHVARRHEANRLLALRRRRAAQRRHRRPHSVRLQRA